MMGGFDSMDEQLDRAKDQLREILVRPATPDDIPVLLAMGAEMVSESPVLADVTYDASLLGQRLDDWVGGPETSVFIRIAEQRGRIAGVVIGGITEGLAWIERDAFDIVLYVTREARRGRVASQLVCALTDWAREQGARQLTIANRTGLPHEPFQRLALAGGLSPSGAREFVVRFDRPSLETKHATGDEG